jgi:hypothetical protein
MRVKKSKNLQQQQQQQQQQNSATKSEIQLAVCPPE